MYSFAIAQYFPFLLHRQFCHIALREFGGDMRKSITRSRLDRVNASSSRHVGWIKPSVATPAEEPRILDGFAPVGANGFEKHRVDNAKIALAREVVWLPLESLKPFPENPRKHP